ncbi:hypothetical protein SEA_DARBY_85 [Arthrobacter phage Darby]|uniref:Uncharacterized protein n=2 Tax=Gordonvirus TaxID=1982152 RepID=A0A9E7NFQ6_9CAUD|nr:hypothetical protein FDH69_gp85 [Arthrobacter phage Gordon]YP_010750536.1 hypothetical protein QCN39_gp85 [Arthrobacter phage Darby]ALY09060.1 hypothetical protein GORDON_85 [Arthrobacter phage Gordon]UTN92095.1 hypothetical protein SEA_DARBY_85 [Arthrobacter phage Darby]
MFSCPQIAFVTKYGQKPTFSLINFSGKKKGYYRKFGFCPKKVGKWADPDTWTLPTH